MRQSIGKYRANNKSNVAMSFDTFDTIDETKRNETKKNE